jgi:hypothetical protein
MTGVNPTYPTQPLQTQFVGEVRDLKGVADKLNKESDALQEILATMNTKLAELNIGLDVWCELPHEIFCLGDNEVTEQNEKTGYRYGWAIGYTKLQEGWSIAVREVRAANLSSDWPEIEPDGDPISLLKAPRTVRIAAAQKLCTLINEINNAAERGVKAIEDARRIAEKL